MARVIPSLIPKSTGSSLVLGCVELNWRVNPKRSYARLLNVCVSFREKTCLCERWPNPKPGTVVPLASGLHCLSTVDAVIAVQSINRAPEDELPKGLEAAGRAVAADRTLAEAHGVLPIRRYRGIKRPAESELH
jgi:hypothetical protein